MGNDPLSDSRPYYDEDGITIYHGDCRDILPALTVTPDLVVTDPPYPGYEKGWDVPDVRTILASISAPIKVVFWPVLIPSPLDAHTAEHVWHKPNGQSLYQYERVLVGGGTPGGKVWRIAAILPNYTQYAAECVDHPTQKPIKLLRRILVAYPGQLVLDPFMGSGTTLRAAKDLGRRAIGIETEERFCEIAVRRLGQGVLNLEMADGN